MIKKDFKKETKAVYSNLTIRFEPHKHQDQSWNGLYSK
jgi:hypothetical protein